MTKPGKSVAVAAIAAVLATAAPVRAEEHKGRSATVVKWTLIGLAAGAGIGFAAGFNAYDDATYAESRIGKATVAGGAIGAAAGFGFGLWRSQPASQPSDKTVRPVRSLELKGPAPTLRSLALPRRLMP